jgi:isopentenyl phosphate kinase
MIVLKLGGSLITDKSKTFSFRRKVVERLAGEIKESGSIDNGLVIVHGGGSFGHPMAEAYGLAGGVKEVKQLIGVASTRSAMTKLNTYVIEALVSHSIPAVTVQTSAVAMCEDGRIKRFDLYPLKRLLSSGLVPVLYGDVVIDDKLGFSILSGDQILTYLSRSLKPERIILATDVDGVFDRNPKEAPGEARLISILTRREFDSIDYGRKNDATGGIKGKLLELMALAQDGYEAQIINALRRDRLKKALSGGEVKGTKVRV